MQYTSSHTYDFEIPFKNFKSPLVDLAATTKFHQHLIVDFVPVDTYGVRRYKTSQKSQRVTQVFKKSENIARVSLLHVKKFR